MRERSERRGGTQGRGDKGRETRERKGGEEEELRRKEESKGKIITSVEQ